MSLIATGVPVTQGTWTPSLGGNTTYTVQTGVYTRIGRQVTFSGHITVNVLGTGSTLAIGGLPFAAAYESTANPSYFAGAASSFVFVGAYIGAGGTTVTIVSMGAAGTGAVGNAFFTNGTDLYFSGSYIV